MPASIATIEQTAQVSAELANDYMVGSLGEIAGVPGAAQLQTDVVNLMGDLGIQIAPPGAETGFVGAAVMATRAALAATAKKGAAALAKNPKGWGAAIGLASIGAGAGLGGYAWLTEDQTVKLEQIRQAAKIQAQALQGMTPDQRAALAQALATSTFSAPGMALWPWMLGAAGLAAWWYFRDQRE